ncbi:MFS transporter [Kribbella alba]|uniref:MFS transporter n=1 Tax=Kribbella alba TaxID=190197 RepID=A0ABN2F1Y8_9ACTN
MDGIDRAIAKQRQADLLRRSLRRHQWDDGPPPARFGLPRELWLVVFGMFLNYVGYGAVLPFEVIYLHDGRGFSLGVAGLVVGLITGAAVVTAPLAGPLIDRFGARAVATYAGVALAAGYIALAFAESQPHAFLAAAIAGAGNGALNPSQSTLVATLAPKELRHRATAVSRVAGNAGAGLGAGLGGLIATAGLTGFVVLFVADGVTYLVYVGVLVVVVRDDPRPERVAGGYRVVVRDRAFLHLAVTNVAMIAVGWGVFTWLLPPYAEGGLGISASLIGLLLLANAATVAVAQVPIAKFAEGRRRVTVMGLAAWAFVGACQLVITAGVTAEAATVMLVAAVILVGLGECFHTTVLMPLVADLAPAALRGRYMASMGLSWWIGLAIAPAAGAQLLSVSPTATFVAAAVVALLAGVSALTLERHLPDAARLTPRPPPSGLRRR